MFIFVLLSGVQIDAGVAQSAAANPPAHSSLSVVDTLRTHGHFRKALSHLDSLKSVRPNDVEVLWRRALILSDIGREASNTDTTVSYHERALAVADSARAEDPTHAWAHLVTALAAGRLTLHVGHSRRVRYSRAVKHHTDRAIELDSTLAPAYHLRGRWHREVADLNFITRTLVRTIYGGLPDASFEQSIQDFKSAIRYESKPYNHLELAKTYLELGRNDSTRHQLHQALQTSGSPFDHEHKEEARRLLAQMN